MKITIPSLEQQKEIIKYCEFNDTLIKQLEIEIESNKKQAYQFIINILHPHKNNKNNKNNNDEETVEETDEETNEETDVDNEKYKNKSKSKNCGK
jgi:hypothetical protein